MKSLYIITILVLTCHADELRFLYDESLGMPFFNEVPDAPKKNLNAGIIPELAERISENIGYNAKFIAVPRKRVESFLLEGNLDVVCYTLPKWLKNSDKFQFSVPLIANKELLIGHENITMPTNVRKLNKGVVGIVLGYIYPDLEHTEGKISVTNAKNNELNFNKFLRGRVDYILTNELFIRWVLNEQPDKARYINKKLVVDDFKTVCALSRSSPVSLEKFNSAIQYVHKSGEYNSILKKYSVKNLK